MLLIKIFRTFNRLKIRYMVIGGVAGVLYGNPRFTKDLDIWVEDEEANLEKVIRAFKALRFMPRMPVKPEAIISRSNRLRWKKEKGMLALTFINPKVPFENVDLLFEGPSPFKSAYKRRRIFRSGGIAISTISRNDLITMKQRAGRIQDLQDVAILKESKRVERA